MRGACASNTASLWSMISRSSSFHSCKLLSQPKPGRVASKRVLTCAGCGALSIIEHISVSLPSRLHNSRRNKLILQQTEIPDLVSSGIRSVTTRSFRGSDSLVAQLTFFALARCSAREVPGRP